MKGLGIMDGWMEARTLIFSYTLSNTKCPLERNWRSDSGSTSHLMSTLKVLPTYYIGIGIASFELLANLKADLIWTAFFMRADTVNQVFHFRNPFSIGDARAVWYKCWRLYACIVLIVLKFSLRHRTCTGSLLCSDIDGIYHIIYFAFWKCIQSTSSRLEEKELSWPTFTCWAQQETLRNVVDRHISALIWSLYLKCGESWAHPELKGTDRQSFCFNMMVKYRVKFFANEPDICTIFHATRARALILAT